MDKRTLYEIGIENDIWREVAPNIKVLMSLICALPGGDELEDLGIEPVNVGWREFDQLGRWIMAIDSADDVKATIKAILHGVDGENDSSEE